MVSVFFGKKIRKLVFAVLAAAAIASAANSQTSIAFAGNNPPVKYLGIEHGLSNNLVTSIFQDHNGFMWFGTFDGLNRYDGYSFKVFRNVLGDTSSLNGSGIRTIADDADHQLWIGTGKGLNIYNPFKANFYSTKFKSWNSGSVSRLESGIRAIQRNNQDGSMLVGTQQKGLVLFQKNGRTGVQIPFLRKGYEGDYNVKAIAFDSSRQLAWVFVQHEGLCVYNIKNKVIRLINGTIKKADCLKLDSKGNLWLGNENGFFLYDIRKNLFSNNIFPFKSRILDLYEDPQGILWICSDGNGVWSMPVGQFRPVPYVSGTGTSLTSRVINTIHSDKQGNKWIGTLRGGINIIPSGDNLFKHISFQGSSQNNSDDFIFSFAEDQEGNVWISTEGAGLRYWDRHRNTFTNYRHNANNSSSISSDFIASTICDSQGDLWAVSWFTGVNRLKKSSQKFEHFDCYNPFTSSFENNAWQIFEDSRKQLWVSAANGGALYVFNRKANRFEVFDETLTGVQCISEDRQGNILVGFQASLVQTDRINKKHRYWHIGQSVRCILEDRNKNLWLGTDDGGLLLFDRAKGTYQRITTADGLPSNTILRMLEDDKNNLWLSTFNGLCKFNAINKTCRNFSASDGLQSNQFSYNAALALKSGEFLFGGIKGFNVFYPDSVYERNELPRTYLTGLKINNKPIEQDDEFVNKRDGEWVRKIVLPYNEAILSLDYVALDYKGADRIKYAYKLEGWDKDWSYVNNMRTANYSRLHEGTYAFKIKLTTGSGRWSGENALLTVVILPPWYRTWWAYLLYAVVFAAVMYLYIMYNRRQERLKYEIRLANLKIENEKEITEKKLSFFTNISHEFRAPLTLIINPLKDLLRKIDIPDAQNDLNIVHRNARRLLSLVDQLLLFRKADAQIDKMKFSKKNFSALCEEVYLCFVQQAKINNQEYVFECNNKELELYIDREKIEIALFNLISNAIKYTPYGGKVIVRVTEDETDVQVSVIDNGYGIPKEAATRLFEKFYQVSSPNTAIKSGFGIGLYLVKHFVEHHNGNVHFETVEGEGTTFIIKLQKGKMHLGGQIIRDEGRNNGAILEELIEEPVAQEISPVDGQQLLHEVVTDRRTILITDDNEEIRKYLHQILKNKYDILEAENGKDALRISQEKFPDLVISDIRMSEMDGIELCKQIKQDEALHHIPVILLTGTNGAEVELQSVEVGADVYITKPFDKDILLAKMENLFRSRNELHDYFFNEITLKKNTLKIAPEHKEFLNNCIAIVEQHLENDQFSIKTMATEMGMSHSFLYKKIRLISGQSVTGFIRYIRLRKAAELLIKTDCNVNQAAYQVGISDTKYFRNHFNKLFGINPSEYRKKYREPFNKNNTLQISRSAIKEKRNDV
jgi:signal transduction histidine kinase/ligand-binding sensor domain-containing protein/DNA-binding response OmpR family regulator